MFLTAVRKVLILFVVVGSPAFVTSLVAPDMPATNSKLALIDRDGVINQDVGPPGVIDPAQLKLTKDAGIALGKLRRNGYKCALITNQSCVGKGLITEQDLGTIHERMHELLLEEDPDARFDEIFYCTSVKEDNDHRSKPNPGMIEEALQVYGAADTTSFDSIFFVGDTLTDLQAAASANVPTRILVETGYGRGIMRGNKAPTVDGTVEVVNENERNKVDLSTIDDKTSSSPPKASIFPFLYTKNFSSAIEYILIEKQ